MIMAQEEQFIEAREEFDALCDWIDEAGGEGLRIDQVERGLFSRLLTIGRLLLKAFVAKFGLGDAGETVERGGRTLRRSAQPHGRRYLSIFGELKITRFVYAVRPKQKIEYAAVDEQLGLPVGETSYVLEDWFQRLCVKESFEESVQTLHDWLGVNPSVRNAESINRRMAEHAESYRSQPPPPAEEEGEIIVVAADGKGVPMRRALPSASVLAASRQGGKEEQEADGLRGRGLHHRPLSPHGRRRDGRGGCRIRAKAALAATQAGLG